MDLFFVLKMKLDARSCIPKKMLNVVLFQKTHWKTWRLLGLGQVNDDIFTTGTADPMIYLDQDHTSSSTTSLWKHWWGYLTAAGIYCKVLPSADSFLLVCHFLFLPRKYSSAILMLHFGQLWQAASGSWRQDRDYPKHLSTFSVKKFHYRTLEWPVCV